MDETTEPTREWIEKRIAQLEGLLRGPEPAVGWEMDLAVYRMALRTLDAEAQLDHARRRIDAFTARDNAADETIAVLTRQLAAMTERAEEAEAKLESSRQVEACSKAFHDLVVKERDFERVRAARLEEERDVARVKIAAMTERADRLQRHFDEAAPEHNLPALLDLYAERERAATERAEKAERLSATLRAVAEQEVADAIVKSRERATRVGWIDHATGDYEERAVTMLMDDLAAGSAVCAFLRMVGVWTLEDRAELAERERGATSAVLNDLASGLRDALNGFAMVGEKWTDAVKRLRARLAEVEMERDEEGRLRTEWGALYTDMVRQRDDWHEAAHAADERAAVSSELREAAEAERDALRTKLADAERRVAEVGRELSIKDAHIAEIRRAFGEQHAKFSKQHAKFSNMHRRAQRAESATADARRESIGQRMRADWWRDQAKRLGWTPDYPELREEQTSDARLDCESSSLLLLSTWARRVMMRPKNRAKGVPSESVEELIVMARKELTEARDAIEENAPTDDILAELGDAAAIIGFAMREIEKRRKA